MLNFFKKTPLLNYVYPAYQPTNVIVSGRNTKPETEITEYEVDEASSFDSDEMKIDKIYRCL